MEVYYSFVARILSEIYSDTTLNISKLPQQKKFYLQSIPCRRVLGMATTPTTPVFLVESPATPVDMWCQPRLP